MTSVVQVMSKTQIYKISAEFFFLTQIKISKTLYQVAGSPCFYQLSTFLLLWGLAISTVPAKVSISYWINVVNSLGHTN